MKLSKKTILIVTGLAAVAFVGLSILQVQNLRSSITTNRRIFLQKVDLASSRISSKFISNKDYLHMLYTSAARVEASGKINDSEMDLKMRRIINEVLEGHGLNISYEYAIYEHKESESRYEYVMGDSWSSPNFELGSCTNPKERGHGWTNLTCSKGFENRGDLHLALFFPDQDQYVFAQSRDALLMSIAFILLLIACFAYAIIIIQKQKKLSVIKNDFINNLTHEFKTPIASISLATRMLKNNKTDIDQKRRSNYLDLIDQESKRLEGQVDKVLQIAMIDSGNFSLDKKKLDVHEVVNQVVDSMALIINKRNGKIELCLNATHTQLIADKTHLVNIIYNLIENAVKYTIGAPKISITTSDVDEGVQVSIRDNGIGIGKEVQKYIFDKFYRVQTGDIQDAKGFGLGLSYVKKIIEEHKGHIDLNSKLNQGSEFRLYFPFS